MNDQEMNNELYHYGVLGMKWGVRRASKQLRKATDRAGRDAAITKLNKHKSKGESKIAALEKKRLKLDDKLRKSTKSDKVKAANIERKAVKYDMKAGKLADKATKWYRSDESAKNLLARSQANKLKAEGLHAKASSYKAKYEQIKAKVDANEAMQQMFKTEIGKIDNALADRGRRYVNG